MLMSNKRVEYPLGGVGRFARYADEKIMGERSPHNGLSPTRKRAE
jgi:hypothetical protein